MIFRRDANTGIRNRKDDGSSRVQRGYPLISPRSVNLRALLMKFLQDLRHFPFITKKFRQSSDSSKVRLTEVFWLRSGRNMPRRCGEETGQR